MSRRTKQSNRFTGRPPPDSPELSAGMCLKACLNPGDGDGVLNQSCWCKHRPCLETFQRQRVKAAQSQMRCVILVNVQGSSAAVPWRQRTSLAALSGGAV